MKEEGCLICHAPMAYLQADEEMCCAVCGKKEGSKARCQNAHYVCDNCHARGLDEIFGICLASQSKNPIPLLQELMDLPICHMHGPEHHILVGAALLTAYKNAGGDIDLKAALVEMKNRGEQVPGGSCGFWGACGAGLSAGMYFSIVTLSSPLSVTTWGLSHKMTSKALADIGELNGPRCCKRNSMLALLAAIDFTEKHLGVKMEKSDITCIWSAQNPQCIGARCPFSAAFKTSKKN